MANLKQCTLKTESPLLGQQNGLAKQCMMRSSMTFWGLSRSIQPKPCTLAGWPIQKNGWVGQISSQQDCWKQSPHLGQARKKWIWKLRSITCPYLMLMTTFSFPSSHQILSCWPNQKRCQSLIIARTVTSVREPGI